MVDVFATVHNTPLHQLMSPVLEPKALAVDAVSESLSHDWRGHFDCPLVAASAVVSAPDPAVCGSTLVSPMPLRSAVSTRLHLTGKAEVVQDRIISDLISPMELKRPREVYLKHCKMVILQAMAGRHSELHALVFGSKCLQFKIQGSWLHSILAPSSCIRTRNFPKLTTPGLSQRSLL